MAFGPSDSFWSEFTQFSVRTPIVMRQQSEETAELIQAEVSAAMTEFEQGGMLAGSDAQLCRFRGVAWVNSQHHAWAPRLII